jgi:putative addiction module killer protein
MIEVRETSTYAKWFAKLADRDAKARIVMRIRRLSLGNFGDAKSIGNGIAELHRLRSGLSGLFPETRERLGHIARRRGQANSGS